MCEASARLGKNLRAVSMAPGFASFGIDHVPGAGWLFRTPSRTLEYLIHPTRYETAATTALLAEVGVRCTTFDEHLEPTVPSSSTTPRVGTAAMA